MMPEFNTHKMKICVYIFDVELLRFIFLIQSIAFWQLYR